jgi:hypothetical protein
MKPLTDLLEKNKNFHELENMIEKEGPQPEFRYIALETEFSTYLTAVLDILRDYGDLKNMYDIPQMLKTLKICNWKKEKWQTVRPFEFYLTQLKAKVKEMRDELLNLHKLGQLYCRYYIE